MYIKLLLLLYLLRHCENNRVSVKIVVLGAIFIAQFEKGLFLFLLDI